MIEQYVRAVDRPRSTTAGAVEIVKSELLDDHGRPTVIASSGARLVLRVTYRAHAAVEDLLLGFSRRIDRPITCPCTTRTSALKSSGLPRCARDEEIVVDFHFRAHLTRGQYHLGCHVFDTRTQTYTDRVVPTGILTVDESRTHSGIADLQVAPVIIEPAAACRRPAETALQHAHR